MKIDLKPHHLTSKLAKIKVLMFCLCFDQKSFLPVLAKVPFVLFHIEKKSMFLFLKVLKKCLFFISSDGIETVAPFPSKTSMQNL